MPYAYVKRNGIIATASNVRKQISSSYYNSVQENKVGIIYSRLVHCINIYYIQVIKIALINRVYSMSGDKYSVTRQQNVSPDVLSFAKMVNIIKTIAPVEKVSHSDLRMPTYN